MGVRCELCSTRTHTHTHTHVHSQQHTLTRPPALCGMGAMCLCWCWMRRCSRHLGSLESTLTTSLPPSPSLFTSITASTHSPPSLPLSLSLSLCVMWFFLCILHLIWRQSQLDRCRYFHSIKLKREREREREAGVHMRTLYCIRNKSKALPRYRVLESNLKQTKWGCN